MSSQYHPLTEPMAYYVAAQATADWLVGETPRAIHRWDIPKIQKPSRLETSGIIWLSLEPNLAPPDVIESPTRSELKASRNIALNRSFVALSGMAGLQFLKRFDKEAVSQLFHLLGGDVERASKIFRPLADSDEMSMYFAFSALESTISAFQEEPLAESVKDIAAIVLKSGSLTNDGGWLEAMLEHLQEFRESPKSFIAWPTTRGKFILAEQPPACSASTPGVASGVF